MAAFWQMSYIIGDPYYTVLVTIILYDTQISVQILHLMVQSMSYFINGFYSILFCTCSHYFHYTITWQDIFLY